MAEMISEESLKTSTYSSWRILHLSGRLDAFSDKKVITAVRQVLEGKEEQKWAIDISSVEFMSVGALTELVKIAAQFRSRKGRLVLFRPTAPVLRHIEIFAGSRLEIFSEWVNLQSDMVFRPRAEFSQAPALGRA